MQQNVNGNYCSCRVLCIKPSSRDLRNKGGRVDKKGYRVEGVVAGRDVTVSSNYSGTFRTRLGPSCLCYLCLCLRRGPSSTRVGEGEGGLGREVGPTSGSPGCGWVLLLRGEGVAQGSLRGGGVPFTWSRSGLSSTGEKRGCHFHDTFVFGWVDEFACLDR